MSQETTTLHVSEPLVENQSGLLDHDQYLLLVHAKDDMILQQQHTIAYLENELERLNVFRDSQQLWADQNTALILERDTAIHRAEQLEWELQALQAKHKATITAENQLRMETNHLQSMLGQHAHALNDMSFQAEHARLSVEERLRVADKTIVILSQRLQTLEKEKRAKSRPLSRVPTLTDSDGTSPEAFQFDSYVDGDRPLKESSDDESSLSHSPMRSYGTSSPKIPLDSRLSTLFSYFDEEGGSLDLDGLRAHGLNTLLAMQQALKLHNARDTNVRTFRKRERIRKALSGQIGRLRGQR